jgi:hypothetical protein
MARLDRTLAAISRPKIARSNAVEMSSAIIQAQAYPLGRISGKALDFSSRKL